MKFCQPLWPSFTRVMAPCAFIFRLILTKDVCTDCVGRQFFSPPKELLSTAEGQRPMNYSSFCCSLSCWIVCFKNSHNQLLSLSLQFYYCFFLFIIFYHHIYLSFYYICLPTYLPTYLCQITYVYLPTSTYLSISTHLPTYDYLPTYVSLPTPTNLYQHTYLPILTHLPTYVYTPTHTNPCQPTIICTYLYQSLSRSCFTNGLTTFFVE